MKKPHVYAVNTLSWSDSKYYSPGYSDPALYPDYYWIVKCKDGTHALADAYSRGYFYNNGTLIKNVIAFSTVYLP